MKNFLFILLLTGFLSSCKYDNTVSKYMYNNSMDTITVNWENENYILLPGESRLVQIKLYGGVDEGIPCELDNEFIMSFSSGRTLVKELDSAEAWDGNIGGNRHLYQECYFRVNEVDLQ